ncbi:DUF3833 family protein [Aliikangiella sp. IMCC44359]|uniref:DUF3833 family protein n=1 Tax=Aliikangiella sp. IMCC44359 TaxID=3459125 RepID=UPI00403AEFC0
MKYIITSSLILLLSACSSSQSYREKSLPALNFEKFFSGSLCAWGIVRHRDGEINRKFIANINAYKKTEQVILDEKFVFDDGENQSRTWIFQQINNNWIGSAGDVVGQATGKVIGDLLHLNYSLLIKQDNGEIEIDMDDWLHLIDENTLMGTTNMTKWNISVGRIDIVIQKQNNNVTTCL